MGKVITEGDQLIYFLVAIGPHYRILIQIFSSLPESEQTFSKLQDRILQHEEFEEQMRAFKAVQLSNYHASSHANNSSRGRERGNGRGSRF